jgi:glycine hydroxymethyltransferase
LTDDEELARRVGDGLYPCYMTNHHLMNVAALAVALAEMLEYGEEYASQVVQNAKTLGAALAEEGFEVVGEQKGFTNSHQVLVKTAKYVMGDEAAKLLERGHIITNKMELKEANGIRIGTSEVTRLGMGKSDMKAIASYIKRVLIDRQEPEKVARDVKEFTRNYRTLHYSFDSGKYAYQYFKFE